MQDIAGKTALVTGAGGGIGRAAALALAREGARLIVCDICEESLQRVREDVSGISHCLLAELVDVSNRAAMQTFAARVHAQTPAVDILVNNAGVALAGRFEDLSFDDWDWVVSVNLWGVIHGCQLFVPPMVVRGAGGHVVNVVSMMGYSIAPGAAAYTATKFGVLGMTLSMREDLRDHGIGVSAVCPGIIHTNIVKQARIVGRVDADTVRAYLDTVYRRRNCGPERVARAIVRAIKRNRALAPVTPEAHVLYYLNRFCPALGRALMWWGAKRIERYVDEEART